MLTHQAVLLDGLEHCEMIRQNFVSYQELDGVPAKATQRQTRQTEKGKQLNVKIQERSGDNSY